MSATNQLIRAVQVATRRLASSGDFDLLVSGVLSICVDAVGSEGGTIYLHDAHAKRLRFQHVLPRSILERLPSTDIPEGFGIAGAAFQARQSVAKAFPERPVSEHNSFERATGVVVHSILATPLMMENEQPIGVVQLINKQGGDFNDDDIAIMEIIAAVSTMAYLNFRLTEESSRASTLLGMGKVSHDIGNLAASLHANISFGEMALASLQESAIEDSNGTAQRYVDELGPTFSELRNSVDRIVGYSRLVSDMSAGRPLRPTKALAKMGDTVRLAASYLESEARSKGVAMRYELDEAAPPCWHDELYVFRMVQNLVGNAVKAVGDVNPEAENIIYDEESGPTSGTVTVRYRYASPAHEIAVTDTGSGMTKPVIDQILSGNARSQWEKGSGSGWGTKIVLELAKTHGGVVRIESEPGAGSTFSIHFSHLELEKAMSSTH